MVLQLSFSCLCLCYVASVAWGQAFNPQPMSARRGPGTSTVLPRNFRPEAIQDAFNVASNSISGRRGIQSRRPSRNRPIPVARHKSFQSAMPRSRNLENVQELFEEATRILSERYSLSPEQIMFALAQTDLKSILQGNQTQSCEAQFNVTCRQGDRYRSFDGTCNNLRHPSWGMAASCYERLVDPDYADGIADKRQAMSGNPLPDPRRLSTELHSHYDNPTDYVTHMFMAFGQFLAHDFILTPQSQGPDGEGLECCPITETDPANCDPIRVDPNDAFFRQFNITCLDNARSSICSTCSLGPRQQTDQVTAYIDASHVYGLNTNQAQGLRSNDGTGTMRVSTPVTEVGELLPGSSRPADDQCSFQDPNLNCFEAGDQRANQHPALTSLHIIFLREHNRIARRLREVNPRWDGETTYQEARRIVGAMMQKVVYAEYLPLVVGPERMEWFDLSMRRGDQFTQYDETIQATLVNEFSTAAFRFGHSMINSFFQNSRTGNQGNYLRDIFNYPFDLYRGQLEGLVEGLASSPSQKFDRYMVRDVTNHLYQNRGNESGLDLASLNINRGRDHGIPGYTALVEFCGGPVIRTWRDLDRLFQRGLRTRFESLYERVEDIDLFSGGLAERPNQGAVIGPTFTCILGIQFYHLKYGDRFYFEHGGQAGSFTPAQLREIKKMTLGKIICNNARIEGLAENVMLYPGNRNPVERCSNKPDIDLRAWRV